MMIQRGELEDSRPVRYFCLLLDPPRGLVNEQEARLYRFTKFDQGGSGVGRRKARKKYRSPSARSSDQAAIEAYMGAVQEAVLVSNTIERLDADTTVAVIDQLTPYSGGGLAVYGGLVDRERLARIAAEYGTAYTRFVLLAALFFAHALGGFPAQSQTIRDIAGSSPCPDEPPQLSADLDKLLDTTSHPEGTGLAAVFMPQVGAAFQDARD
ncbi:hypothetical protein ACGFWE_40830 [Streptomyces sp. NPDC048523]|uniref:hypothetical protein n=1 Tax=Streptomyces sp. NPDC048523 TaxID=3365567 RepID=UPI0037178118